MRVEAILFGVFIFFFIPVAFVYGYFSGWEPVGFSAILLVAALCAFISGYFWLVSRRIDRRPEDDPNAEVAAGAGEQGTFSPWSWWPLLLGAAAATIFAGLAIGWWLFAIGAMLGLIGMLGWVFEGSRGPNSH